ncbi:transcription termination factor 5, mitochondrial isoform X2 [Periplaneta americana]|uniref:transcription termination factor 5, mitochondrial isoform X2 n=1 Tax=Periplaneta americana TaxID=6978 RepID=UPI0037E887D8
MYLRLGVTREDIAQHPEVLMVIPVTIENRSMLLQEGGFSTITAQIILSYITVVHKPIRLLKLHRYIPSDVNIIENFLSHLKQRPPPFEPLSPEEESEETAFLDVQLAVLRHYLCWRLELTPKEVAELMKTYSRLKHRSFRLIERALKILEEKVGFSKDKIRRNAYLIHSNPDNTLDTLKRVKSLGGIDIRTLFHKFPKLVMSSTDSLIKIAGHLKQFDIPDEAIQKCPQLFTLSSETVLNRVTALQLVPEFIGLAKNPRVLKLVYHQRKASSRLSYLQDLKIKCVSLHILSSTQAHFERYVQEGSGRTRGNDMINFLSTELDANDVNIRKMLHRHPFWCQVPLNTVRETLDFLFQKGFTKQQILLNVHILLYSRTQVEKELNELPTRPELDVESCQFGTEPHGKRSYIAPEQKLALCLYFIERDFHFTGHGIWADSITAPASAESAI